VGSRPGGAEVARARLSVSVILLLALAGCASPRLLAPPTSLYSATNPYPEAAIPQPLRQPQADIIFATDRVWNPVTGTYVAERSARLAIGQVTVSIGSGTEWNDLMDMTAGPGASKDQPDLTLSDIRTDIVFPATPLPYTLIDGAVVEQPETAQAYAAAIAAFQDMVRQRLKESNTDTVLLYVHGFNAGLDDAAFDLTDIWHHSGRGSVPIVFSWPTVEDNLLGYFSARESGEFSIFHLKEVFRALQGIDEVRTINVVAHSRGVDVTSTTIRELLIEARGSGRSPRDVLKIDSLILAAADIDVAVAGQRLGAERIALAIGQITIYSNPEDSALGLSSLVSSGLRVGRSNSQTYQDNFGGAFLGIDNIAFVDVSGLPGDLGHNYFRLNPNVIADIAVMLQTGAGPKDPARRLKPVGGNFYELIER
jgi:esterase/lipase superfamily enzyme